MKSYATMHPERRRRPIQAAVALLGVLTLGATACESIDPTEPVSTADGYAIAYVIDGDTLEVTDPDGATQRVRLLGINTPEVAHEGQAAQCGGEEASMQLAELLPEGTAVQLVTDARADAEDRYGRLLRYVETENGTDAGRALITEGYAYAWAPSSEPEPERMGDYEDSTAAARTAGTGSWSTCPDLDQSR
ncbi:MAG: thermonuclease family protein [Kocuria sp.]|nr:thermonuclease family protein [Kocuria sp.]